MNWREELKTIMYDFDNMYMNRNYERSQKLIESLLEEVIEESYMLGFTDGQTIFTDINKLESTIDIHKKFLKDKYINNK
jgi:transposase